MDFESERLHVGEGWQELITTVHTALTALFPEYEILQIKEKFGGLRYYWAAPEGADPALVTAGHALVDAAEAQSFKICERCGKEGSVQSLGGWLVTLCDEHHEERAIEIEQRRQQLHETVREMGEERD